jgi:DNA topoisomerase-1
MKNLVIVESPAKAKTIEKFLGPDFFVTSSRGHIRDLASGNNAIDVKNGFKPVYEVSDDKRTLVMDLKKLVSKAETIWLATDEDREGEAISWHLFDELKLNESNTKRIVFNEITKPAILNAVAHPRTIDKYLVDAQQARRVLDRLVGFELSPVLWRRVRPSLSAGRVQSVAVRLVVEREREINDFTSNSEFRITCIFKNLAGKSMKAELSKRFKTEVEANAFLESIKDAQFKVENLEVKPTFRNPAPPFTTSTLQQEASRKLGYDVTRTMQLAQKLYENGHISYMRTDSVNLSQTAILGAKDEIIKEYGEKFSHTRVFSTKSENAQEAHEAIRPTYFNNRNSGADPQQKRLYELIWKRAIASQMAKAELEKTIITISNNKNQEHFKVEGEVIKFEGFLKVYLESTDDEDEESDESVLPAVAINEKLTSNEVQATERFAKSAPRYSEASLVKKLEELGIGRPSTYAPTIQTVQKRGYVVSESREGSKREIVQLVLMNQQIERKVVEEKFGYEKNKLFPTDIGTIVTDFLLLNFHEIMDYGFTASVEKEFDEIAKGLKAWQSMIQEFYTPFSASVELTNESGQRATGERILGIDPESGLHVIVRLGRYGALVQLGSKEEIETPKFASLMANQSLETINLEEALQLFKLSKQSMTYKGEPIVVGKGKYGPYVKYNDKFYSLPAGINVLETTNEEVVAFLDDYFSRPQLPREIGNFKNELLTVNKGRFGPYIKFGDLFVSLAKGDDPFTISLDRAIELCEAKAISEASKILKTFDQDTSIQIVNGRYGAFIKFAKDNVKIPSNVEWESLTYEQVIEIIKNQAPTSKKGSTSKKDAPAKKAAPGKKASATKTTAKAKPKK